MVEEKKKDVQLEIDLDENTAQGLYSNLVVVNHSDTEFVLDFIYLQPMQPKAKVRSRIITSPKQAKKLLDALAENLKIYEERFGTISSNIREAGQQDSVH
ncbi:MAG: DUF3467 domain-containing protein [Proteobacteria bacterium]|nr:DUF3467 domain-containing protein [Pseudomonadota bacterium]